MRTVSSAAARSGIYSSGCTIHYTPEALRRLLANHGLGTVRSKSYLSEHVKENLERTLVLKPFARLIARCYSGHSFAVVAKKVENREQASP